MQIVRNAKCHLCHVTQERTINTEDGEEPTVTCILCGGETSLSKPAYHARADKHWRLESGDKDAVSGY